MAKTVLLKSGFTSHLKDNSINVKCLAQVSRPGLKPTLRWSEIPVCLTDVMSMFVCTKRLDLCVLVVLRDVENKPSGSFNSKHLLNKEITYMMH